MQERVGKPHPSTLRPRDAATLILVRTDGSAPQVMMGQRHSAHTFMPGKFVFPGGRVDLGDCRITPQLELDADVYRKLTVKMKGTPSPGRTTGLALAAVRETFEEVGLILGQPGLAPKTRNPAWKRFFATGYLPDLRQLRLLARAITPPGRPRRFDTRFFIARAEYLANMDGPVMPDSNEILTPQWLTIADAVCLDVPNVTRRVLHHLETALATTDPFGRQTPVPYQYMRGGRWHYETL